MTEAEWLACVDPRPMIEALRRRASQRKFRLFSCAAARLCSFYDLPEGSNDLKAILAVEEWAEGDARVEDLAEARELAQKAGARWVTDRYAFTGARTWANTARADSSRVAAYCGRARCIFGHPFRRTKPAATWRDGGGMILTLARAASAERILPAGLLDQARLGVLSDALEEAGCTDADILGHLRAPGPHVRGCWVLDLICGKV